MSGRGVKCNSKMFLKLWVMLFRFVSVAHADFSCFVAGT